MEVVALILAIACFAGGYVLLSNDESQRVKDLIRTCEKASVRTAADVNLNWLYYLSETQLAGSTSRPAQVARLARLARIVSAFAPQERPALMVLFGSTASRAILRARAAADFDAAFTKAQTVQLSDARLIVTRTLLGSGELPRRWVLAARYSCAKAYSS